ncbi:DUF3459 domain-containing protein, partial [Anaerolineae bacterium CFX9]|nr:DUF3459 domain-containing protein [Anaerolineae bacterium CFX9]
SINREKLNADTLLHELATRTSLRSAVFSNYVRLLEIRTTEPAFHPLGGQAVLELHPAVFALERTNPAGDRRVIALHNVSGDTVTVTLPDSGQRRDLIGGQAVSGSAQLAPYQVMWLRG